MSHRYSFMIVSLVWFLAASCGQKSSTKRTNSGLSTTVSKPPVDGEATGAPPKEAIPTRSGDVPDILGNLPLAGAGALAILSAKEGEKDGQAGQKTLKFQILGADLAPQNEIAAADAGLHEGSMAAKTFYVGKYGHLVAGMFFSKALTYDPREFSNFIDAYKDAVTLIQISASGEISTRGVPGERSDAGSPCQNG